MGASDGGHQQKQTAMFRICTAALITAVILATTVSPASASKLFVALTHNESMEKTGR